MMMQTLWKSSGGSACEAGNGRAKDSDAALGESCIGVIPSVEYRLSSLVKTNGNETWHWPDNAT